MREMALPGQTRQTGTGDAAVVRAREKEDIVVGDEIVRHRLASRVIHWAVALFFFVALFTGLPIWTPLFGWMATFAAIDGPASSAWTQQQLGWKPQHADLLTDVDNERYFGVKHATA